MRICPICENCCETWPLCPVCSKKIIYLKDRIRTYMESRNCDLGDAIVALKIDSMYVDYLRSSRDVSKMIEDVEKRNRVFELVKELRLDNRHTEKECEQKNAEILGKRNFRGMYAGERYGKKNR